MEYHVVSDSEWMDWFKPGNSKKRVLILGCGFGGMSALQEAEKLLKSMEEKERNQWSFTVVDGRERWTGGFLSQYIVSGRREEAEWSRPMSAWAYGHFAQLIRDEVTGIDVSSRTVHCRTTGAHQYDHLLISMGCTDQPVPLVKDKVFSICNFEHMRAVREILPRVAPGWRILITVARMPFKCPPAPFEFAFLIDDMLKKRGLREGQVEVALSFPACAPVPMENPEAFTRLIREKKLTWIPGCQPSEIEVLADGRKHKVTWMAHPKFNPNGSKCAVPEPFVADLIIGTWPQQAPSILKPFCNEMGYVPVDTMSLRTVHENVYCIGDSNWMMLPTKPEPKPHPKAGGFAEGQGRIAMRNILAEMPWTSPAAFQQDASCRTACASETGLDSAVYISIDLHTVPGMPEYTVTPSDPSVKERWVEDQFKTHFNN